jgi:hypothetical protein
MLPLELAYRGVTGGAAETRLKLEGIRDALAGRRPPFERLGLR